VILIDTLTTGLSLLFFYIMLEGRGMFIEHSTPVIGSICVFILCYIVGFRVFHTYNTIIRFSSFVDLLRILYAAALGCAVAIPVSLVTSHYIVGFPVVAIILGTLSSIATLWAVRIFVKMAYDVSVMNSNRRDKVFIYGVGEGGIALAKSMHSAANSKYTLAGFIADEAMMVGKKLIGVTVYANDENVPQKMRDNDAAILLVSPLMNDAIRSNTDMVDRLISNDIKIHMTPATQEWDGKSDLSYDQLHEINIEDLLPRDKIEVDMESIGRQLSGHRILITGAAGSIGSEMVRQIAPFRPSELILVDQAETPLHDIRLMLCKNWPSINAHTIIGDISNGVSMERVFKTYKPEYVFHAAAYKHVPMMEDNPAESIENNVKGTRIIADLAVKYGTLKFVMISTDKAVNPTNVMGCSKRLCEIYVQSLDRAIKDKQVDGGTQFVTTRFGNVLGSNGSVIPLFETQIKAGGPVTVTHPDIIRFFMLIPEACKLVLEAGTMGKGGEIFVFDMGKPVRIADLAKRMIKMSGAKNIDIKYTGLRDGEKLYEEVLSDEEVSLPTFHKKIKIARVREYDYADVSRQINALIDMARNSTDMDIVRGMKNIVPEFKSQHSKYEALDKH